MCGIAGILQRHAPIGPAQHAEMDTLLQSMRHRGPDASASHAPATWSLLGANRLRITDPGNTAADMPLRSTDGRATIVFNGEIYNHRRLRAELSDYLFRTASDTEVILAAYQRWGRACLDRLDGMFAFAIHDTTADAVWLACDPTGQKTLYLWEDAEHLVFASEIDALVADPYRKKSLDLNGLAEFVVQRFIVGRDTHLRQIEKLESGTWLTWSRARREHSRYYTVPPRSPGRADMSTLCERIRAAVVEEAVVAYDVEVPHALLSSGGIDSAAVLAGAHDASLQPLTYSIGFSTTPGRQQTSNSIFDEFEYSRRLARDKGSVHTEIVLNDAAYCESLDRWNDVAGEPLGSQEAPCLLRLFEAAGATARVAFSGSGPDELFDGYSYGLRLEGCSLGELPERYARTFHWAGSANFARLLPGRVAVERLADKLARLLAPYGDRPIDASDAVQLLHFHGRLGAYEFRQLDLTSMRYGVEARSPLANRALVQAAFECPSQLRHRAGHAKWIYKQALRGVVPDYIGTRKKAGFPIPSEIWWSEPFVERARILFEPTCQLTTCGLLDPAYLRTLWRDREPSTRNLFYRLYCAERVLRRQAPACSRPVIGA
jgi:asparagine synthase (glutamine-hydrolysing)